MRDVSCLFSAESSPITTKLKLGQRDVYVLINHISVHRDVYYSSETNVVML